MYIKNNSMYAYVWYCMYYSPATAAFAYLSVNTLHTGQRDERLITKES